MGFGKRQVGQLGTIFSTLGQLHPDPHVQAVNRSLESKSQQMIAEAEARAAARDAKKAAKRKVFRDLGTAVAGPLGGGVGQSLAGGSFDEGFSTSLQGQAEVLTGAIKTGGVSGGIQAAPGALGGAVGSAGAGSLGASPTGVSRTGSGFVPQVEQLGSQGQAPGDTSGLLKNLSGTFSGLGGGESLSGPELSSSIQSSSPTILYMDADGNVRQLR